MIIDPKYGTYRLVFNIVCVVLIGAAVHFGLNAKPATVYIPASVQQPQIPPPSGNAKVQPSKPHEQPEPQAVQSQAIVPVPRPEPPRPAFKLTPTTPMRGSPAEYDISIQQCVRSADSVHCWGRVSNTTDTTLLLNFAQSQCVDDQGNAILFRPQTQTDRLLPSVPTRFDITFDDPHMNVKVLNFEVHTWLPQYHERNDMFAFKEVPLQSTP
jgi:hypothetical protein